MEPHKQEVTYYFIGPEDYKGNTSFKILNEQRIGRYPDHPTLTHVKKLGRFNLKTGESSFDSDVLDSLVTNSHRRVVVVENLDFSEEEHQTEIEQAYSAFQVSPFFTEFDPLLQVYSDRVKTLIDMFGHLEDTYVVVQSELEKYMPLNQQVMGMPNVFLCPVSKNNLYHTERDIAISKSSQQARMNLIAEIEPSILSLFKSIPEDVRKTENLEGWQAIMSLGSYASPNIVVIYGPSGSGKTSLVNSLVWENVVPIPKVTTRPSRPDDKSWEVHSLPGEVFREMFNKGGMVGAHNYSGDSYGFIESDLESALNSSKRSVLTTNNFDVALEIKSLDPERIFVVGLSGLTADVGLERRISMLQAKGEMYLRNVSRKLSLERLKAQLFKDHNSKPKIFSDYYIEYPSLIYRLVVVEKLLEEGNNFDYSETEEIRIFLETGYLARDLEDYEFERSIGAEPFGEDDT